MRISRRPSFTPTSPIGGAASCTSKRIHTRAEKRSKQPRTSVPLVSSGQPQRCGRHCGARLPAHRPRRARSARRSSRAGAIHSADRQPRGVARLDSRRSSQSCGAPAGSRSRRPGCPSTEAARTEVRNRAPPGSRRRAHAEGARASAGSGTGRSPGTQPLAPDSRRSGLPPRARRPTAGVASTARARRPTALVRLPVLLPRQVTCGAAL
jgi:hypothetical protein